MKKKILSLLTAFAMVFGIIAAPFTSASAAETTLKQITESVTVHKILMDKNNINAKKVTITTGEGEQAKEESKVIVAKEVEETVDEEKQKVTKYYEVTTTGESELQETNDFVKGFKGETLTNGTATATPIFAGLKGIDGTDYNGNEIKNLEGYFGANSKDIGGVYFVWTNEQDQVINNEGQALDPEIKVVDNKLPKGTTKANLANALQGETVENQGIKFDTTKLPTGKYKIYEIHSLSSYLGKEDVQKTLTEMRAVPVEISLPLNDVVNAHVYPKNVEDKPQIDKNFASDNTLGTVEDKNNNQKDGAKYENYQKEKAKAKAEIGKVIPYEVKTEIPAQSKYEILKWTDSMTDGLTFDKESLEISADNGVTLESADYTIIADDHGFTLRFTEAGLKKVQNKDEVTNITLKYNAKVNEDAVIDQEEINDIKFDYGNKPGKEVKPTEVKPKNKEITVEKSWDATGDQKITEADKNVTAVFTLQVKDGDNWKDVDSYTATIADAFKHTFTGLDDTKTYRVVERVSGYEPEYEEKTEDGKVIIKNVKDKENPNPLDPTEPKLVIGGRKFVKADEDTGVRLPNAEFKIKRADGQFLKEKAGKDIQKALAEYKAADKEYKDAVAKLTQKDGVITYPEGVTADSIKELRDKRDKAYAAANLTYEWGNEAEAAIFKSNEKGQLEVYGIEYADNYVIVETKAPAGYAIPSNPEKQFNVNAGSYTADAEGVVYEGTEPVVNKADGADAMRINNKKVTIPQTGGIGSLIFIVAGLAIMGGAFVAYKKSQAVEA